MKALCTPLSVPHPRLGPSTAAAKYGVLFDPLTESYTDISKVICMSVSATARLVMVIYTFPIVYRPKGTLLVPAKNMQTALENALICI